MNKLGIVIIIVLLIIFFTFVIVYTITKIIIPYSTKLLAIKFVFNNDLYCNKNKDICDKNTNINDLTIPNQKLDGTYNKNSVYYSIDLITRIQNHIKSNNNIIPNGLQIELQITNNNYLFGVLWSVKTDNKTLWLAFRGTTNTQEWLEDFIVNEDSYQEFIDINSNSSINSTSNFKNNLNINSIKIHSGFIKLYKKFKIQLIKKLKEINPTQLIISGHSLGAAIATLCAWDLSTQNFITNKITVYSIASPKVGNTAFANAINKNSKLVLYRIVNLSDIVPSTPTAVVPNFNDKKNPYEYTHGGILKYFNDNWLSILNNHNLPVYKKNLENYINLC